MNQFEGSIIMKFYHKIFLSLIISIISVLIAVTIIGFYNPELISKVIGLSGYLNLIATIFIVLVTFLYYLATKEIADRTSESVQVSREVAETTIMLERKRITLQLIGEWFNDKKLLASRRRTLNLFPGGNKGINVPNNLNCKEFITLYNSFMEYFILVRGLLNNKEIDRSLYFSIVGKDVFGFFEEYKIAKEVIMAAYKIINKTASISSDTGYIYCYFL